MIPISTNQQANGLIYEKSPYLLQHVYNPVYWYPWGSEAFEKAKKEDKPIFLSIGYSTCHWCHVMAHESFEDHEVAKVLNKDYICIKVDREESPDIDTVYMTVCQALTGSGGWPLTILMSPDQKPFWAGTYLPKQTAYGRLGLIELLSAIKKQWVTNRDALLAAGEEITAFLNTPEPTKNQLPHPDRSILKNAVQGFERIFDERWGGFGSAPKFPTPHNILFLLQYSVLENNKTASQLAEYTLKKMFEGGLFDHIGGGFSRYSTDEKWLVPHFEKMLYDNALLAYTYLEAYHITKNPLFRRISEDTLDYVIKELTNEEGAFYCGQDADSNGVEGEYYTFTKEEIHKVLGDEDGALFSSWFGMTQRGNFEGKNILNLMNNPNYEETPEHLKALIKKIYEYRLNRTHLHKDDKVLTSWNSLMIAAMAKAAKLLDSPVYLKFAKNAQLFIENHLSDSKGELKVRWREGEAVNSGHLDDYSFYAFALLELFSTTLEVDYLQKAIKISEKMMEKFWDQDAGGFFFYANDSEQLIQRPKETYDGAIPSGNSMAAWVLNQIFKLTGENTWQKYLHKQMSFMAEKMKDAPIAHSMALIALAKMLYPSQELVCVTRNQQIPPELQAFLKKTPNINLTLLLKNNDNKNMLAFAAPYTESYPIAENQTKYYLCQNGSCSSPIEDINLLIEELSNQKVSIP